MEAPDLSWGGYMVMNQADFLRKMKQPLPLTVAGDIGLLPGSVLWMDRTSMVFASRAEIRADTHLDGRLDLGVFGTTVDLHINVLAPYAGAANRVGFLHSAAYRVAHDSDRNRLDELLARLNPTAVQLVHSEAKRAPRRPAHRRPRPRSRYPAADLASGPTPSVLARLTNPTSLRDCVRLSGRNMALRTAPMKELRVGATALLVVQLPDSSFLQTTARVYRHGDTFTELRASLNHSGHAAIRSALGAR